MVSRGRLAGADDACARDRHLAADRKALVVAVHSQSRRYVYLCTGNVGGKEILTVDLQCQRRVRVDAELARQCQLAFTGGDRTVDVERLAVARVYADLAAAEFDAGCRYLRRKSVQRELAGRRRVRGRTCQREFSFDAATRRHQARGQQIEETQVGQVQAHVAAQRHAVAAVCAEGDMAFEAAAVTEIGIEVHVAVLGRQ